MSYYALRPVESGAEAVAVADEVLLPDEDFSSGFNDSTGGDGDGARWDEVDDPKGSPDDGTTFVSSPFNSAGGGNTNTHTLDLGLENSAENHDETQTHRLRVRGQRFEDAIGTSGGVRITTAKLLEGTSTQDTKNVSLGLGTSWTTQTVDFDVPAGLNYDDLRVQIIVEVRSDTDPTFGASSTRCDITQAHLDIFTP